MPKAQAHITNTAYPIAEDSPGGRYQLGESQTMFDLRPPSTEDLAMSAAIDDIHDQLARDLPTLQRDMTALLDRVRTSNLG